MTNRRGSIGMRSALLFVVSVFTFCVGVALFITGESNATPMLLIAIYTLIVSAIVDKE